MSFRSFADEPSQRDRIDDGIVDDRVTGMLVGSLIGDALGGPVEFAEAEKTRGILANAREWEVSRRLDEPERRRLGETLPLLSYEDLRPETAPYGPWKPQAPMGTVTDDSRMKIILLRALRKLPERADARAARREIAEQIVWFQPRGDRAPDAELAALIEEGLAEYRLAAQWMLGERDERIALPPSRLWGGIANCSGQMMLPPVAGMFPGDPLKAYRVTYELDFIDAPLARDFCAALNAGLAAALSPELDERAPTDRWEAFLQAMRETDPLRFRKVPFAGRPLRKWLDLAEQLADEADGSPAALYRALEERGKPVYWWDAHFTLLVPLSVMHLCEQDALAGLHLCLDFGHDTDSYAQVLGAIAGAIYGPSVFPEPMQRAVTDQLEADYGEDLTSWSGTLRAAARKWGRPAG